MALAAERPQPPVEVETSAKSRGRFVGVYFLAGFLMTGLVYAAAILYINPTGDFGPGAGRFPLVRSDYRNEKIALLESFRKERGQVEGLVLGSSRSMLLNGARMQSSSGLRFFNFGLASAKGEDFLAALRYTVQKQGGVMPKRIIIGVDVESLRDARAHGDSIHPLRELAVGPPPLLESASTLLARTVTLSYAKDAATAVYLRAFPKPPVVQFASDGTLQYAARDARRAAGTFSLEAGMAGCMADCRAKIEKTTSLSTAQMSYLTQTVEEARRGGAIVTIWLTGPHPRTAEHMAAGTAYLELIRESKKLLEGLRPYAKTYDLHDEASYGGGPGGWYDCNHFDNTHAERIENILLER